jgi:hypothetical protein
MARDRLRESNKKGEMKWMKRKEKGGRRDEKKSRMTVMINWGEGGGATEGRDIGWIDSR